MNPVGEKRKWMPGALSLMDFQQAPSHGKVAGKVSVTLRQLQDGGFDEILASPESMLFTTEIL